MKLFICVDNEGGMTFMGRRVSRDRVVTEDIAKISGDALTVFPYSERLFQEAGYSPRVISGELNAETDTCLFIEERSAKPYLKETDTLVIYRWNRLYPSDLKLDFSPIKAGFSLKESCDLVGRAHEKITREIYTK